MKPNQCTATRVATRWAITALHCTIPGATNVGTFVSFYDPTTGLLSGGATIVDIKTRPGTNAVACSQATTSIAPCYDSTGHVADIAILQLANFTSDPPSNDPLDAPQAIMAWAYPGHDVPGTKVGAGRHDGNANPNATLLQVDDETADTDDSIGDFHTATIRIDPGDSGGPFYVDKQILGTLSGNTSLFSATYTSVPFHLDWILTTIGYQWPGSPSQPGIAYNGTQTASVLGTEQVCQYACEHTESCQAYNYLPAGQSCGLYTNITGTFTAGNAHSALRWGQGSGRSGIVSAYDRSDGFTAVIHHALNHKINELLPNSSPAGQGSLFNSGPANVAAGGRISGYRRADGVNAVVYRDGKTHIIELTLDSTGHWNPGELTAFGGLPAAGDPVGYVRADNVSAVVYRSTSNHIIELRLATRGWVPLDLTVQTGAPLANSDPSASVRSDGISSVTYRSGNQIFELTKAQGSPWNVGEPSALADGGSPAVGGGRPYGYTHRDGTYEIVYGAASGQVVALFLTDKWHFGFPGGSPPSIATNSTPAAYVRTDGLESIVYRTSTNTLEELENRPLPASWTPIDQSKRVKLPPLVTDPVVSIHTNARNSIVYTVAGNHVQDLSFVVGFGTGPARDLTADSGETP